MRTRIAFALLAVAALAVPAFAKDKTAWEAAQASLPKGTNLLVGIDVAKITATETFKKAVTDALAAEPEAKEGIAMVQETCGIDIFNVVSQCVVGMNLDTKEGAIFLQLNGVDEKKLTECGKKILSTKMQKTLTAKKKGTIVEYTVKGETDKLYVGWPAKNVLAFAFEPEQKAMITKVLAGKGKLMKDAAAKKALAAVKPTTLLFGAAFGGAELTGAKVTMVHGFADLAAGKLSAEIHAFFTDAAVAAELAKQGKEELAKEAAGLPPALGKIVKSVTLTAKDTELVITGSATEAELAAAVKAATGGGGGAKPPTQPPPKTPTPKK